MTKTVIITDQMDFISVDLLARQIKAEADKIGRPCEIVKPGKGMLEALHKANVISLKEGMTAEITDKFRWFHPKSFVTVIAGAWEEYSDSQRLALFGQFLKPNLGGVPVALVAHSPHTMDFVGLTARKLLAPSVGRDVLSNVKLIMCGIEDGFEPGENDPDRLVVPFNHFTFSKQPTLHARVSRAYSVMRVKAGHSAPTHHYWHHPTKAFGEAPSEANGLYEVEVQPDSRDQFRANIRECGMFLGTSSDESFGLYVIELLASGAVGVFIDKPWVRKLLPGYPFVASADNLLGMMLKVRENYQEARAYVLSTVRPMILTTYTINKFSSSLFDLSDQLESRGL